MVISLIFFSLLINVPFTLAQVGVIFPNQPPGTGIQTPPSGTAGLIQRVITIIFAIAVLLVLWFLILGAFNWITSGGDKEKIASARKMIVNALIGLAILALSFFILRIAVTILNINPNPSINPIG